MRARRLKKGDIASMKAVVVKRTFIANSLVFQMFLGGFACLCNVVKNTMLIKFFQDLVYVQIEML